MASKEFRPVPTDQRRPEPPPAPPPKSGREPDERDHLLEVAWGIIANASGSDWSKESETWEKAAMTWRAQYFRHLDGRK